METYKHLVEIVDRYITIKGGRRFVAGNANVDTLIASFDAAWKGCEVSVIFAPQNGEPVRQRYGCGMTVPPEALTQDGFLYVTFVGTRDGNVVIETAMQAKPFVIDKEGVVNGADPVPPTPSEYQQLMAEIRRIRQDIEAGLIKGDPGDDADIAGANAAKEAANAAAKLAKQAAEYANNVALDVDNAIEKAENASYTALLSANAANDAAQAARDADTYATAAASNANDAAEEIMRRADSGEFDGKDGYTPVKGVDYFDGEAGHSPVITASKADGVTTIYSDGVVIASIDDGVAPEITAAIISNALGFVPQKDTRIDGSSIVNDGVADIPMADLDVKGAVVLGNTTYGVTKLTSGALTLRKATDQDLSARTNGYRPIVPNNLDTAVKFAMSDGKGDDWTGTEQLNARKRIGLGGDFELIEEITLTTPTNTITRSATPSGKPYSFKNIVVVVDNLKKNNNTSTSGFTVLTVQLDNIATDHRVVLPATDTTSLKYITAVAQLICGRLFSMACVNTSRSNNNGTWYSPAQAGLNIEGKAITNIKFRGNDSDFLIETGTKIAIYGAWA